MRTLRGKKALVTGAASGIGRAIALALAREGVDLHLLDANEPRLADVVRESQAAGVDAVSLPCDLARPKEVTAAVQSLKARWGVLHLLVNNAGIAYYGPTDQMTAEQWCRIMRVNLLAPIQLVHELLPTLLALDEAHVVNVCSIGGLAATKYTAAYHAAKFGLVGFSQSLRIECARSGVGVTALCPGFVRTDMFDAVERPHPTQPLPLPPRWTWTSAEVVARRALRAIRNNEGLVVITPLARVLWLAERWCPRTWDYVKREGWRSGSRRDISF